jgi:hypothetical protein
MKGHTVFQIHIIEETVLGIPAWHARCPSCGWRCHKQAHDTEAQAIKCAERHNH